MKKIALTLLTLTGILTLAGCGNKTNTTKVSFKQMAENSALSSISMLDTPAAPKAMRRALSDDQKKEILDSLDLVDELLKGAPIKSEEKAVPADSEYAKDFDKFYTLTVTNLDGTKEDYTFYYKETLVQPEAEEEKESKDKKEEKPAEEPEQEVSSDLDGIVLIGDKKYKMHGDKEVSKEGKEVEVEYEFKITDEADPNRYVVVKQEVETEGNETENEYVYEKFENGKSVRKVNIEYEQENGETEYLVSNKSKGSNVTYKFKFEKNGDKEVVKVHIHKDNEKLNAKLEMKDGKYVFVE